jgi:hypothetical protein
MKDQNEIWLPIPELPSYELSNMDRVRKQYSKTGYRKLAIRQFGVTGGMYITVKENGIRVHANIGILKRRLFPADDGWKPIPSFPEYEIHEDRRVRSLRYYNGRYKTLSPKNGHVMLSNQYGQFSYSADKLAKEIFGDQLDPLDKIFNQSI